MKEILNLIKPYYRKLPRVLQRNIYNCYMTFPFLGRFGVKDDFKGWGMTTQSKSPDDKDFLDTFASAEKEFGPLKEYIWRLWIIRYAVRHSMFTEGELVECGVENGLSAYVALKGLNHRMHLYDSWCPMRSNELLDSEKNRIGKYKDLTIEPAKRHLSQFDVVYHKGFIPESLTTAPEKVSYLHIDINSAIPTKAALEFFFPRMSGGVILFDDYGWKNYPETKKVVDKFFTGKQGILMPLPTGQAIYYKETK